MKTPARILIASVLVCLPAAAWGECPDEDFANELFSAGAYEWSILEYERLIFFCRDTSRLPFWRYRVALSMMGQKRFEDAIGAFLLVPPGTVRRDSAMLHAAKCAVRIGRSRRARSCCALLDHPEARLTEAYVQFMENNHAAAAKKMHGLSVSRPSGSLGIRASAMADIIEEMADFRKKRYVPAGLLAVVPGLGHVYTRRYGDGLTSAVMITAGAGISWYYAVHDATVQAAVTGIVSGLFYAGSIYGALVSVKLYNRKYLERRRKRVEWIFFHQ